MDSNPSKRSNIPHPIVFLSDTERQNPFRVLRELDDFFELEEARSVLQDMMIYAMGSEEGHSMGVVRIKDMLFFFKLLQKQLEAAHLITYLGLERKCF